MNITLKQKIVIKSFFHSVICAFILAFLFQTLLYQPFKIPSSSMEPNLLAGDYIFVNKFAYGYNNNSLSFGLNHINITEHNIYISQKRLGDVVVFYIPHNNRHYVKRVVGLPGDKIKMHHGNLYINNTKVVQKKINNNTQNTTKRILYKETLPNDVTYYIYKNYNANHYIMPNNTPEYCVPINTIFCLGDNRDNSIDSRYLNEIGFIKENTIIGKAQFIFWTKQIWYFLSTKRIFTIIK